MFLLQCVLFVAGKRTSYLLVAGKNNPLIPHCRRKNPLIATCRQKKPLIAHCRQNNPLITHCRKNWVFAATCSFCCKGNFFFAWCNSLENSESIGTTSSLKYEKLGFCCNMFYLLQRYNFFSHSATPWKILCRLVPLRALSTKNQFFAAMCSFCCKGTILFTYDTPLQILRRLVPFRARSVEN